jgi:hypothetical protein
MQILKSEQNPPNPSIRYLNVYSGIVPTIPTALARSLRITFHLDHLFNHSCTGEETIMRSIYLTLVCGTALTLGACNDSSTPDNSNANNNSNRTNTPAVDRTTTVDRSTTGGTVSDRTRTDTTVTKDTTISTDNTTRAADNTGVNKRDRSDNAVTPMDQSNASEDIKIVSNIRRAIMDDNSLSMTAKNIKVITAPGGAVTLRGPVNSAEERTKIEAKVREIAGVTNVTNELEVKASENK